MNSRLVVALLLVACARPQNAVNDSAFAEVQRRGKDVMGVDQYTSKHVFEDRADGGRIRLERDDASDTAAVNTIRAHMRDIAAAFDRGDFTAPGLVHAQTVPGTAVMRAERGSIHYSVNDLPRGAEVSIVTVNPRARNAVHQFLAFQRSDHRASGHTTH